MKPVGYGSMREKAVQQQHERRSSISPWLAIAAASYALWLVLAIIVRVIATPESFPWTLLLAASACAVAAVALVWRRR